METIRRLLRKYKEPILYVFFGGLTTLLNMAVYFVCTKALKMGLDSIDFSTLPNEWKSPYIYLNPDETLTLVNTYLNPYVEDRTAEDLNLPS